MREVILSYRKEYLEKRRDNTQPAIENIIEREWYDSLTKKSVSGERVVLMVSAAQEALLQANIGDLCSISTRHKLTPY